MRYEYLVLEIEETASGLKIKFSNDAEQAAANLETVLNSYGAEGWQLATSNSLEWVHDEITTNTLMLGYRLIFQRPVD